MAGTAANGRPRRVLRVARRVFAGLGVLAVAASAWLFAAPASLGGVLSATAVSGASMDPAVRSGDLVILAARARYRVGDVVAYRNRAVAHTFLHRIVREHDGRFALRGDRNGWLDPGRARRSDISGAMLLRVPHGGALVAWLQVPAHGASIAALITASAALAGGGAAVRRRRRRRRAPTAVCPVPLRLRLGGRTARRRWSVPVAVLAGLALAIAGAGSVVAWTTPATSGGRVAVVRESASLVYAADVPPSAAYPDGRVRTGDPVYLAIVRGLNLAFDYRFASAAPHRVDLAGGLAATVSDGDGWRHAVALTTSSTRLGDVLRVHARLDLVTLRRLLARVQSLTGVAAQTHGLAVQLRATATGSLAGRPVRLRMTDTVGMRLDALQLHTGGARIVAGTPRLAWRGRTRRVPVAAAHADRLAAGGASLTVARARAALAASGLAAAVLLGLALAACVRRPRRGAEAALADARAGRLIVPLAGAPALPSAPIDVRDMQALVRIARRYDAVILHHSEPAGDSYLVVDGESVYRFARGTVSAPVPPTPAVVPADPPGNRGERLLRAVLAASRSTARLP